LLKDHHVTTMLLYDTLQKHQANIDPLNWLISSPADHSTTLLDNNASQRPRWGLDPGRSCGSSILSTKGEWFRKGICTGTQDVINMDGSTFHLSCTCLFFRKKIKYMSGFARGSAQEHRMWLIRREALFICPVLVCFSARK
jgi:hypothetical protein